MWAVVVGMIVGVIIFIIGCFFGVAIYSNGQQNGSYTFNNN